MSEGDVSGVFFLFFLYWHSDLNVSVDKQLNMCDLPVLCFLKYRVFQPVTRALSIQKGS